MKKEVENKWVVVIGCPLMFRIQFIGNMVTVALPKIASDLDLTVEMLNAINLDYLIMSLLLMPPIGKFVSKRGIGKYLKYGIVLMIWGLLLSDFSTDISTLLLSRVIQELQSQPLTGLCMLLLQYSLIRIS